MTAHDKYKYFEKYGVFDLEVSILDFLIELWSINPFREGNTRACVTFLWHYLKGNGVDFQVELLRKNPMYVRDSLIIEKYGKNEYLLKIISDALVYYSVGEGYEHLEACTKEQYQIAKSDIEAFQERYSIKK